MQTKRAASPEALRLIAMLMVISMHYLNHTGALPGAQDSFAKIGTFAIFAESFCLVAVNCYVLLTGYYMSRSAFKLSRFLRLMTQVWFYTILIPIVLTLCGVLSIPELLNPYHLLGMLFPISSGHYWFISAYLFLLLLAPFLNAAIQQLDARQYQILLVILLAFTCLLKSICPLQLTLDRYGYDLIWFLCLYLTGAGFGRFGFGSLTGKKKGCLLWIGCSAATALMELCLFAVVHRTGALVYYSSVPFHYNFILCYLGSIGFFAWMMQLVIPEGKAADLIRTWSPAALGVYLVHEQMDVSSRWCGWLDKLTASVGLGAQSALKSDSLFVYLLTMLVHVLLVFVLGLVIDQLRRKLFGLFKKQEGNA